MHREHLDALLDRYCAASSSSLFVLCAVFGLVLWWRILFSRARHVDSRTEFHVLNETDTRALLIACAVTVSAISVRFFQQAGGRLGHFRWSSFEYDLGVLISDLVIIVAVICAIWRATHAVCGATGTLLFGGIAALTGIGAFFWG